MKASVPEPEPRSSTARRGSISARSRKCPTPANDASASGGTASSHRAGSRAARRGRGRSRSGTRRRGRGRRRGTSRGSRRAARRRRQGGAHGELLGGNWGGPQNVPHRPPAATVGFSAADPRDSASTAGCSSARLGARARLRTACERPRRAAGGLVLIEGAAGAGKTALMDARRRRRRRRAAGAAGARRRARARVRASASSRQLFEPARRAEALFTGAARFAAPVLGVIEGAPAAPADDPFAARHALYWLAANLAAERPLALLVDDAHWADAASLGVARPHRQPAARASPVALVVAAPRRGAAPALEALRRQAAHAARSACRRWARTPRRPSCARSRRAPTTRCAAPATPPPAATRSCCSELARAALGGRRADARERVAEQSPERVTREIAARGCARLPDRRRARWRARRRGARRRRAAAPARRRSPASTTTRPRAADALIAGGVLRGAHPLEFLHPLIGAAVYAGIGPAARSREHAPRGAAARRRGRVARARRRAAAALPAGRRRVGVRAARRRGAPGAPRGAAADAVATYLQRALEEPPPPEQRAEVLLDLGARGVAASTRARRSPTCARRWRARSRSSGASRRRCCSRACSARPATRPRRPTCSRRSSTRSPSAPDLRGPAEAALANITRIDPRPAGARTR